MQIDSNLKEVAAIPGWQERKGPRNAYVMLMSLFGTPKPTIIVLDYECNPSGGLTYRQLHQQVREALELKPKESLRMISLRPWYRYMVESIPVPEHRGLPANDNQCRNLFGTTLLYYTYTHMH